jgi:alkylhydroperoxidase family enzyme
MSRIKPLNEFTEEIKKAHKEHVTKYNARITNMKATMSRSLEVFEAYMQWYPLYDEVKKITGERAAYLFAFAISSGSNCPLCTTYFRKTIIERGENPDDLVLNEREQLLLDFGSEIANNKGYVGSALYDKLAAIYSETELVVLTGFAGVMIATNIFNNVFEVAIDEYLTPYLPPLKS